MKSKIADALKLKTEPVAVLWADEKPEGALQYEEEKWGCVIPMLNAASKGRTACFDEKTIGCMGGKTGLGFQQFQFGYIEHFLAQGIPGKIEGEAYRKNPEMAKGFINSLPAINVPKKYLIFKPLDKLEQVDQPVSVIFLVNPDQLSACVTLASFDKPTKDNAIILAAAGCHQTVLEVIAQGDADDSKAVIGLTDITARKYIDKDLLSFALTYKRFMELEAQVEESFLTKKDWIKITERIC